MKVIIDGIEFHPCTGIGASVPRIGIAITTYNRPGLLEQALDAHQRCLPQDAALVVVDDGSTVPVSVPEGVTLIRHSAAKGIAAAKNACIATLMDAGCDHLFLFDDDTWPAVEGWWKPYVQSPAPHLMYLWGDPVIYRDEHIIGRTRPKGCMLYVERRVVDRVGGMDPRFGAWGFEHESWSDRIHNAGFTVCRYQDVVDSDALIQASDRVGNVASSVPEAVRLSAQPQLAERQRDSDAFIEYRERRDTSGVALSVLVPSVHTRWDGFARQIQQQLFAQHAALPAHERDRVEILLLMDTKSMQLGDKRNELVRLARGQYVVFVDDDDRLEPDYLAALLRATDADADCITFHAKVSIDGATPRLCRYSLDYAADANTAHEYHRIPNHICAVKRSIALRTPFPSLLFGEDQQYAMLLRPLLQSEKAIGRVLYHYDFNQQTTETQLLRRTQKDIILRARAPEVDVVFLSRAGDDVLRQMTQAAIDSCRSGAGDHPVNVVVIEQVPGVRYRDAITMPETREFSYNAFCNRGARTGAAPWIMFANNDLHFEPNWLKPLLDAKHPLLSSLSPGETRQAGIVRNEQGSTNGRHFSGWCFMMRRDLWEQIGGLDEDFRFWCADDSVIEQCKAKGIKPMVVPASRVKHLTSKTIGEATKADGRDDGALTWAQVWAFEQKYGVKKFEGDKRYAEWKRKYLPLVKAAAA